MQKQEHYWSLVIEHGWVQSALWTIEDGSAKVEFISTPTHWEAEEDLINAADTCLSMAVQGFGAVGEEPEKTVFGVPPSWVQDGQIKEEHLNKIKKVCSKLSLKPSGFVVLPEAIAHYMKIEEGTPTSSVIIGLGEETIDVSLFKLGNFIGTVNVARSVSIFDDVVEGLARFADGGPLPSRFLIYDGKEGDLDGARQALVTADWTGLAGKESGGKLKFLHTPKVEVVDPKQKAAAVCLAGASEIAMASGAGSINTLNIAGDKQSLRQDQTEKDGKSGDEFQGQDNLSAEDVGFAVGKDVGSQANTNEPLFQNSSRDYGRSRKFFDLSKLSNFMSGLILSVKKPEFGGRGPLFLGGAAFIILLIAFFAFWWFVPKATVTIYLAPQQIEESVVVSINPKMSTLDLGAKIIPGKIVKTTVSGEKTASATGVETTGEKAKGTVEIRNATNSVVNLNAGALLTAGDLKFVLDDSVSVPAKSSTTEPGTATANVTASDFGSDSNLAKGETFLVSNYPKTDVDALGTSDFSGGSSREVSVVSSEDRQNLESDLTDELLEEGKKEIVSKIQDSDIFISEALTGTSSAKNFSNKVGDEVSTLKLSLNLDVEGLTVSKENLNNFAKEILKDKLPEGFVLRDSQIETGFELEDSENGVWKVRIDYRANLLPEIDTSSIAKKIAGKYPPLAESFISTVPGFKRVEIKIDPSFLPGRLAVLPRIVSRISVEVAAEK